MCMLATSAAAACQGVYNCVNLAAFVAMTYPALICTGIDATADSVQTLALLLQVTQHMLAEWPVHYIAHRQHNIEIKYAYCIVAGLSILHSVQVYMFFLAHAYGTNVLHDHSGGSVPIGLDFISFEQWVGFWALI